MLLFLVPWPRQSVWRGFREVDQLPVGSGNGDIEERVH